MSETNITSTFAHDASSAAGRISKRLSSNSSSNSSSYSFNPKMTKNKCQQRESVDGNSLDNRGSSFHATTTAIGDELVEPVQEVGLIRKSSGKNQRTDNNKTPTAKKSVMGMAKKFLTASHEKRSEEFKKHFPHVDERLLNDFSCAIQKDILIHGRMYVTESFLCFNPLWTHKISISLKDVVNITKEKTALVIPNAILVSTRDSENYIFTSFLDRDKVYRTINKLWQYSLQSEKMSPEDLCALTEGYSCVNCDHNHFTGPSRSSSATSLPESMSSTENIENNETNNNNGHHNHDQGSINGEFVVVSNEDCLLQQRATPKLTSVTGASTSSVVNGLATAANVATATTTVVRFFSPQRGESPELRLSRSSKSGSFPDLRDLLGADSERDEEPLESIVKLRRKNPVKSPNKFMKHFRERFSVANASPTVTHRTEAVSAVRKLVQPDENKNDETAEIPFSCECETGSGNERLNLLLPVSVDRLFNLMFVETTFLSELQNYRKTTDMVFENWNIDSQSGGQVRKLAYVTANKSVMAPKTTSVHEIQRVSSCSQPGSHYKVVTEVHPQGKAPYADCFFVRTVYCLSRFLETSARITIYSRVEFKKYCFGFVKGFIEKEADVGSKDFMGDLSVKLRSACGEVPVANESFRKQTKEGAAHRLGCSKEQSTHLKSVSNKEHKLQKLSSHMQVVWKAILVVFMLMLALNFIVCLKLWLSMPNSSAEDTFTPCFRLYNEIEQAPTWNKLLKIDSLKHCLSQLSAEDRRQREWMKLLDQTLGVIQKVEAVVHGLKSQIQKNSPMLKTHDSS